MSKVHALVQHVGVVTAKEYCLQVGGSHIPANEAVGDTCVLFSAAMLLIAGDVMLVEAG
jgi:hypothetical protein